jgi:hypothetical protein
MNLCSICRAKKLEYEHWLCLMNKEVKEFIRKLTKEKSRVFINILDIKSTIEIKHLILIYIMNNIERSSFMDFLVNIIDLNSKTNLEYEIDF